MQIGPYSVLGEVARGGHGVVYRAQDAQGQVVALKLLLGHRAQNPRARQRFQAEVNALARLRHPGVVPIVGAGEYEGAPWLALEFVEGESLADCLRRGPLPIHRALDVGQQLAQALSYVHGCGVLHRDLKPDNVLLRGGQALLTDFGLVLDQEHAESRITATGAIQGTPGYWAPEQAQGQLLEHGPATDVYGLGAVLYACLTGQAPVQANSLQEFLQAVGFASTPPPQRLRPEVPRWLSELCLRCLAVDPAQRPASADEVARALVQAGGKISVAGGGAGGWRAWGVGLCVLASALAGVLVWGGLASDAPPGDGVAAKSRAPLEAAPLEPTDAPADPEAPTPESSAQPARDPEAPTPESSAPSTRLVEDYLASAGEHSRAGRFDAALALYDRALELDPNSARAYVNRGLTRMALERFAEGLADFDRALQLQANLAGAYAGRGVCKAALGRRLEALEDFDRALELDPQDSHSLGAKGESLASLGRDAEAVEAFDRAVALDPNNTGWLRRRAYSRLSLGRNAGALEDCERAVALDPTQPNAYAIRGQAKARLQRYREAIEDFDRALQLGLRGATEAHVHRMRELAASRLRGE